MKNKWQYKEFLILRTAHDRYEVFVNGRIYGNFIGKLKDVKGKLDENN